MFNELVDGGSRQRRLDDKQVGHAGLVFFVIGDDAVVVGHCGTDPLCRDLGIVQEVDDALGVGTRLAHLRCRVLQVVNLRGTLGDEPFGHNKGFLVAGVEAFREVASELDVLALVFTHGYKLGAVQQDVCGHQHGVGEQACPGAVGSALGGLVLKLGHAGRFAEAGHACQDPSKLRVLRHVALDEQCGLGRVDTKG